MLGFLLLGKRGVNSTFPQFSVKIINELPLTSSILNEIPYIKKRNRISNIYHTEVLDI